MHLINAALLIAIIGGLVSFVFRAKPATATALGVGGMVLSALVGLAGTGCALSGVLQPSLVLHWSVPFGAFSTAVDGLSGFFLIIIFVMGAVCAVYGAGYTSSHEEPRRLGAVWFFFNLLVSAMALVVIARNAVLFLVAWEVMALSSFFLVTHESEHAEVRQAGQVYLIATHIGVAFLFLLFIVLAQHSGSFEFAGFATAIPKEGRWASIVFLLAIVGFGSKAGLFPFHIWLPDAHPAAPSFVSAMMSGVMIKLGIYGLLRVLGFFMGADTPESIGAVPYWWAWLMIGIGFVSAVGGIVFAAAQHDLKRLLAYSSIENIGIVLLGIGLGVIGWKASMPVLFVAGFTGALFHVLNHALFKGLLFLGAGAILHVTGTRKMDLLGGLSKKMPEVSTVFLIGVLAICALPPLNGFMGEMLVYFGAFRALMAPKNIGIFGPLGVLLALSVAGAIAAAVFSNVYATVFLGEPRARPESDPAPTGHGHKVGRRMKYSMYTLAALCVFAASAAPWIFTLLVPLAPGLAAIPPLEVERATSGLYQILFYCLSGGMIAFGLFLVLFFVRRELLLRRTIRKGMVWDCGYVKPTSRMQYTASGFAQPLTRLFKGMLGTRQQLNLPSGYFPRSGSLVTETPDSVKEGFYIPMFAWVDRRLAPLRALQHGKIQLYIFYILVTLILLLTWKLGGRA